MLRVYAYKNCGTCRKAVKWLTSNGVVFEEVDITSSPPSTRQLKSALKLSGLPISKLFNTSGQSYREGNFKDRLPNMSESEALSALSADGKLIKRPLIIGPDYALVGFDEARYEETLR